MSPKVKDQVKNLIEQYFRSIPNDDTNIAIDRNNLNKFLSDFSEIVISRTLDTAFNIKD